jgi:hypothetical protein
VVHHVLDLPIENILVFCICSPALLLKGVMDDGFWSVSVEYAKANPHDILCRYTIRNDGNKAATIHVTPTLWYR